MELTLTSEFLLVCGYEILVLYLRYFPRDGHVKVFAGSLRGGQSFCTLAFSNGVCCL